jgi:hypothetical protein
VRISPALIWRGRRLVPRAELGPKSLLPFSWRFSLVRYLFFNVLLKRLPTRRKSAQVRGSKELGKPTDTMEKGVQMKVVAKFDYSYEHNSKTISIKKGELFTLLNKANEDWWRVKRAGNGEEVYVPAQYVQIVPSKPMVHPDKFSSLPREFRGNRRTPEPAEKTEGKTESNKPPSTSMLTPPVAKKPTRATVSDAGIKKDRPSSFFGGSSNDQMTLELVAALGGRVSPSLHHSSEDTTPSSHENGSLPTSNSVEGLYDRLGAPNSTRVTESPSPTNPSSEPLPDGWKEYHTPDGQVYYYNTNTQLSSWMRPRAPSAVRKRKGSVPKGWIKEVNPFGQPIFINIKTREKWALAQTKQGTHYYNMADPAVHLMELPTIEEHTEMDGRITGLVLSGELKSLPQRMVSVPTGSEAHHEVKRTVSSEPLDTTPLILLKNEEMTKHGYLNRKRLCDSTGKKLPSTGRNWIQVYVMIQNYNMMFFKDHKTAREANAKPFSVFSLANATVKVATTYQKKKFCLEMSSAFGEQFYLQADTQKMMDDWYISIYRAIEKANEEYKKNPSAFQTPPQSTSPSVPKKPGKRKESVASVLDSDDEEDYNNQGARGLRERLNNLVSRRSTMDQLKEKGIYKDQVLVFACPLENLCAREKGMVPTFVTSCIEEVERRGLTSQGIYRLSGNAADVTKLRYMVDQENCYNLSSSVWEDINVVTGALKLFFRELPDPLIPMSLYNRFIEPGRLAEGDPKRLPLLIKCVKDLPKVNHATLKRLLRHLQRVTEHSDVNKMQIQNIAIVFGPTLMRTEDPLLIATLTPVQNSIVGSLLTDFDKIF